MRRSHFFNFIATFFFCTTVMLLSGCPSGDVELNIEADPASVIADGENSVTIKVTGMEGNSPLTGSLILSTSKGTFEEGGRATLTGNFVDGAFETKLVTCNTRENLDCPGTARVRVDVGTRNNRTNVTFLSPFAGPPCDPDITPVDSCLDVDSCLGLECGPHGLKCDEEGECTCPTGVTDESEATVPTGSFACGDGIDHDCDGLVDCDDPDCYNKPCDRYGKVCVDGRCICPGNVTNESQADVPSGTFACGDGIDHDCDGLIDCEDPDCEGMPCAEFGMICINGECECREDNEAEAYVPEGTYACGDGIDHDCDGLTDCEDPDCDGEFCGPHGLICENEDCICPGGTNEAEADVPEGTFACGDRKDHDCDGLIDCQDPDCDEEPCGPYGKICEEERCVCMHGYNQEHLAQADLPPGAFACGDGIDWDCDGLVDCLDPDCDTMPCAEDHICSYIRGECIKDPDMEQFSFWHDSRPEVLASENTVVPLVADLSFGGSPIIGRQISFAVAGGTVHENADDTTPDQTSVSITTNDNGSATAYWKPGNSPAKDLKATATVSQSNVEKELAIQVIAPYRIRLQNVQYMQMGVKNSGYQEINIFTFQIEGTDGETTVDELSDELLPLQMPTDPDEEDGVTVNFTVNATNNLFGGLHLVEETVESKGGIAKATAVSGRAATSFTLSAAPVIHSGDTLAPANSPSVSIVGAKPMHRNMRLTCDRRNVGALVQVSDDGESEMNISVECRVRLRDRYDNPVIRAGTTVFFWSEAGCWQSEATSPSCSTQPFPAAPDSNGVATAFFNTRGPLPKNVSPITNEPNIQVGTRIRNPRDGFVSIIAYTRGEETFIDTNGTDTWDPNDDPFIDLGSPFIDTDDSGAYSDGMPYIDDNGDFFDSSGANYSEPNGTWDDDTFIWTETRILYTGNVSTTGGSGFVTNVTFLDVDWEGEHMLGLRIADENLNPPPAGTHTLLDVSHDPDIPASPVDVEFVPAVDGGVYMYSDQVWGADENNHIRWQRQIVCADDTSQVCDDCACGTCPGTGKRCTTIGKIGPFNDNHPMGYEHDILVRRNNSASGNFTISASYLGLNNFNRSYSLLGQAQPGIIFDFDVLTNNQVLAGDIKGVILQVEARTSDGQAPLENEWVTFTVADGTIGECRAIECANDDECHKARTDWECFDGECEAPYGTACEFPMPDTNWSEPNTSWTYREMTDGNGFITVRWRPGYVPSPDLTATATLDSEGITRESEIRLITWNKLEVHNVQHELMGNKDSEWQEENIISFRLTGTDGVATGIPIPDGTMVSFEFDDGNNGQNVNIVHLGAPPPPPPPPENNGNGNGNDDPPPQEVIDTTTLAGVAHVVARSQAHEKRKTFAISAEAEMAGFIRQATTEPITIVGAKASQGPLNKDEDKLFTTLNCEKVIVGVNDTDGVKCVVELRDRHRNLIGKPGYKVNFRSESGSFSQDIVEVDIEPLSPNYGKAITTFYPEGEYPKRVDPRQGEACYIAADGVRNPRDGLVTIMAFAEGEEFYGTDGKFGDVGDPFVDDNDSTFWEPGKYYRDRQGTGVYNGPNGFGDRNTLIWHETRIVVSGDPVPGITGIGIWNDADKVCVEGGENTGFSSDYINAPTDKEELRIGDINLNPPPANKETVLSIPYPPMLPPVFVSFLSNDPTEPPRTYTYFYEEDDSDEGDWSRLCHVIPVLEGFFNCPEIQDPNYDGVYVDPCADKECNHDEFCLVSHSGSINLGEPVCVKGPCSGGGMFIDCDNYGDDIARCYVTTSGQLGHAIEMCTQNDCDPKNDEEQNYEDPICVINMGDDANWYDGHPCDGHTYGAGKFCILETSDAVDIKPYPISPEFHPCYDYFYGYEECNEGQEPGVQKVGNNVSCQCFDIPCYDLECPPGFECQRDSDTGTDICVSIFYGFWGAEHKVDVSSTLCELKIDLYGTILGGKIESSDGNIDCGMNGPDCTAAFSCGTSVTLEGIPPSADHTFQWVEGICISNPCTFNLNSNMSFKGLFEHSGTLEVETIDAAPIEKTTATLNGKVTVGSELPELGFIWGLSPDNLNNSVTLDPNPAVSGENYYSTQIGGLVAETTYYYRAYAEFAAGISYGIIKSFETDYDPILSIKKSGNGSVTSDPAGINCGGNCGFPFTKNIFVSLTAASGTGYTFAGWQGDGCNPPVTGNNPSCPNNQLTVRMSDHKELTAIFIPDGGSIVFTLDEEFVSVNNNNVVEIKGFITHPGTTNPRRYFEVWRQAHPATEYNKGFGGMGEFSHQLSNLQANTKYFYRACAARGTLISCGATKSFVYDPTAKIFTIRASYENRVNFEVDGVVTE